MTNKTTPHEEGSSVARLNKFVQWGEQRYAVRNWSHRSKKGDVVIIAPLNKKQEDQYATGKNRGHSDTTLFRHLFEEKNKGRAQGTVRVPTEIISDKQ